MKTRVYPRREKETSSRAETNAPRVIRMTVWMMGFGCVLCRKMYSAVMTKRRVRRRKAENMGMLTRERADRPTVTFETKRAVGRKRVEIWVGVAGGMFVWPVMWRRERRIMAKSSWARRRVRG